MIFFCKYETLSLLGEVFYFRCVCGIFFINHLTPPSEGKLMLKATLKLRRALKISFFWLRIHVISLHLIAFIISI